MQVADARKCIREEWGSENAFEKFVRQELPSILVEAKRQWYRTVPNTVGAGLELIFGGAA